MSRSARWIVVAVVVLAAAFAGARAARRNEATSPVGDEPRATSVAATPTVAPQKRKRTEAADAAPETTPSPDDEKRKPVLVRFRVQTEAGKPVAGAKIEVKWDDAVPGVALVSDEAGKARMPEAVAARDVDVTVKARGFVVCRQTHCFDEENAEAAFELHRGADVAGVVLDGPSGRPIAGARIVAWEAMAYEQDDRSQIAVVASAADGAFTLEDVAPDDSNLEVTAAGHVGAYFRLDENASGPLVLRLDPGGRVRGVVRDGDGSPVAGVWVDVRPILSMGGDSRPNTRSDADGAFALEGLRFDAEYEVRGFGDKVEAHAKATATSAAPEVVVELTLAPPPRASLTVVVKSDGDPPHDVRVLLCHDGETGKSAQKLYDSLTTTIEDLAPGTIHVHAWADGRVVASADVELAGGEAKRVELALVGGLTVVGTVVDDAGAPVDGAEVGCVESVGCGEGEERKTTSDEDGGFRLSVRVPGAHRIGTTAADHVEVGVVIEDVKAGAAVRIVLPRATTAVFRLRPPEEVEGFRVEWTWIDDAGTNVAGGSDRREADHFDFAIEAPVTARRLSVQVDGFVPIDREVRPVLGKPLDLGEIVLDAGAKLVGRVVGSDGHAVASFGISVKTSDEYESLLVAATAQADGTFEAHGFAPGPVLLDVGAAGFLPTKVRVDASKSAPPVVVKLARGAYVRVRVVDADGRATACDDVHAVASDGTDTSLDAKMAGTFAARLPAGRFRFVATRGDVAVEATESLVEGGTSDVTLRFAR